MTNEIDLSRFCISTVVLNDDLYGNYTKKFMPKGVNLEVIDGKKKGYYGAFPLMDQIENPKWDYMLLCDEDCFIVNDDNCMKFIENCISCGTTVSGIRDGGLYTTRISNPAMPNNCFIFLNTKKIRELWSRKEVEASLFKYLQTGKFNYTNMAYYISTCKGLYLPYRYSFYPQESEPYYAIYMNIIDTYSHWHHDVIEFNLICKNIQDDKWTNLITNREFYSNSNIAYHTWYARDWQGEHHKRIYDIIKKAAIEKGIEI